MLPTSWSSSFAQYPRNLSHRILGTNPAGVSWSSPTKLAYRITYLRYHRHYVLGIPGQPIDQQPLMAKPSHLWDPRVTLTLDVEIITTYLIRVACVHNLPYLVIPLVG